MSVSIKWFALQTRYYRLFKSGRSTRNIPKAVSYPCEYVRAQDSTYGEYKT